MVLPRRTETNRPRPLTDMILHSSAPLLPPLPPLTKTGILKTGLLTTPASACPRSLPPRPTSRPPPLIGARAVPAGKHAPFMCSCVAFAYSRVRGVSVRVWRIVGLCAERACVRSGMPPSPSAHAPPLVSIPRTPSVYCARDVSHTRVSVLQEHNLPAERC